MSHGLLIAVVGIIIFIGAGTVMAANVNCGLGARGEDEALNETEKRSDDQTFFTHMVCTAKKSQHNR